MCAQYEFTPCTACMCTVRRWPRVRVAAQDMGSGFIFCVSMPIQSDFWSLLAIHNLRSKMSNGCARKCATSCMMQGNCQHPIPEGLNQVIAGAPLLPLSPGQCLLISNGNMTTEHGDWWADNIYTRFVSQGDPRPSGGLVRNLNLNHGCRQS